MRCIWVLLTHAHMHHFGRLLLLAKRGFGAANNGREEQHAENIGLPPRRKRPNAGEAYRNKSDTG